MPHEQITPAEKRYRLGVLQDGLRQAAETASSPFEIWPEVRILIDLHYQQLATPNPTDLQKEQWANAAHVALQALGRQPICADLIMEARNRLSKPGADSANSYEEYRRKVNSLLAGSMFQVVGILYSSALEIDNGNNIRVVTEEALIDIYKKLYPNNEYIPAFFGLGSLLGITTADAFFVQQTNDEWKVVKAVDPSLYQEREWTTLYKAIQALTDDYPTVFEGAQTAAVVSNDYRFLDQEADDGVIQQIYLPVTRQTFTNFYLRFVSSGGIDMNFPPRRN